MPKKENIGKTYILDKNDRGVILKYESNLDELQEYIHTLEENS
ncbi:MAG: hypothetical protein ACOC2U_02215 [bacterium]